MKTILISNHFVERYRERMLDMSPSSYKIYTQDYKSSLKKLMNSVIDKAEQILFKDLDEDKREYLIKKYQDKALVFFKHKSNIYIGTYVKNDFNNTETILLLTVYKK